MALTAYLQTTLLLLNDAGIASFNPDDLTTYINLGRNQIASEGECVRDTGSLTMVSSTTRYMFSSIVLPSSSGYNSVLNVRQITYTNSNGYQSSMTQRPWEWFWRYNLAQGVAVSDATPTTWSVLGRGTQGVLYVSPPPSAATVLTCDCTILPNTLALDSDIEALPYPFTDAVPFYAAFYAANTAGNMDVASQFFSLYQIYLKAAAEGSTPTVLPRQYPGFEGAALARQAAPLDGGGVARASTNSPGGG